MSKYTNALYPDKINDLVDNDGNVNPSMVPGGVEIAGNALVIPEQPGPKPEPVAVIDGFAYFHKQEFALEELLAEMNDADKNACDLLNKELQETSDVAFIQRFANGPTNYGLQLKLGHLYANFAFTLLKGTSYQEPDFTSRAFTVLGTWQEVTDNTKICLPTCSAYYGFLSEDGKTFISYFNLKSDGAPAFIGSVQQGNAVIPLHGKDVRLPDATAADVGKILAIN